MPGKSDSSLKVGDQLPQNIQLKLLNYHKKTATISEFNSEILILDFWNTHCAACFTAFPKLEALQKKYHDKVSVLLVTDESDSTILKSNRLRQKYGLNISPLPIAYNSKELEKLFDHQIEPHEVWIDKTGKILQITSDEELTEENIECVLAKKICNIFQKQDNTYSYNFDQPLFKNGNGGNGAELKYHSVLSGYLEGLPSATGYHSNPDKKYGDELYGILVLNHPVASLFSIAYDPGTLDDGFGQMGIPDNRTILEVGDTLKYCQYIDGKKALQNWYSYELTVPITHIPELKSMMQLDLQRYFKLNAHIEKKTLRCLVLKALDTNSVSSKNIGDVKYVLQDYEVRMYNCPFKKLVFWLTYRYKYPLPLIDATGIKGSVNIQFETDNSDYNAVAKELKKYNMDLVIEDRTVDVLIITDRKPKNDEQ